MLATPKTNMEPTPAISMQMMKAAASERPYYQELVAAEKKALSLYYGGAELYGLIQPFSPVEQDEKFKWRRDRTIPHYENYVAEIPSSYIEQVYRANRVRRTINGKGADVEQLAKYFSSDFDNWFQGELAPFLLTLPELFVRLRVPDSGAAVTTKAQQMELGLYPRPEIMLASKVRNIGLRSDGSLEWLSHYSQKPDGTKVLELWTDQMHFVMDLEGEKVLSGGPHGFTALPFLYRPWRMNYACGKAIGHSWMAPIIDKTLACLQVTSMLVEAGYFHLNLQLVMDPQTLAEALKTGTGNASVLVFHGGETGVKPYFLDKPSMEIETLRRWAFEDLRMSIYRTARLRDRSTDKTREQSGVAKALDMVPELSALTSIANYFQAWDQTICSRIAAEYGVSGETAVQYPTSYDLKSGNEYLAEIQAIASAQKDGFSILPPTALGEMAMQATNALLPDSSDATKEAMESEKEVLVDRLRQTLGLSPTESGGVSNVTEPTTTLTE